LCLWTNKKIEKLIIAPPQKKKKRKRRKNTSPERNKKQPAHHQISCKIKIAEKANLQRVEMR
jgi:hypothetical protein